MGPRLISVRTNFHRDVQHAPSPCACTSGAAGVIWEFVTPRQLRLSNCMETRHARPQVMFGLMMRRPPWTHCSSNGVPPVVRWCISAVAALQCGPATLNWKQQSSLNTSLGQVTFNYVQHLRWKLVSRAAVVHACGYLHADSERSMRSATLRRAGL